MQTFLRRISVIGGFAVMAALLVVNAFVTQRQLKVQVENEYWVLHTRQVLYELQRTESLLTNAETGQRGFLLTGDPQYLDPYTLAVGEIDSHIANLRRLTADNPTEQANTAQLIDLSHQKLDELSLTISLFEQGKAGQADEVVSSNKGLELMASIRRVLADMHSQEDRLGATRTASYERSIRLTRLSIDLATLVAVIGLLALAFAILKERALRERHTREIHAREEWFRVTLTSIGDAVIATDRNGVVTFFNMVAEDLTGIAAAEAMGKDILSVFPIVNEVTGQTAESPVQKVMALGAVVGLANHTALRHADGHLTPIEDSAAPIRDDREQLIGVVLVFHDVTADRKSQEVVRRAEKLAAAARLSATVAHEINNPLAAVLNLIYISKTDPAAPPAVVERLALAEQEIERLAQITRQTLGFYRESNAPEPINIEALIDAVLRLYAHKIASIGISVERNYGFCPPVLGVAGELRQVFANIITNAIDAIVRDGAIAISTQFVASAASDNGATNAGIVEVVVADTGSGIAPEHLDRIFEPFFTTKRNVGTGLGLWVTREILERHGGSIEVVASESNGSPSGAAFRLNLPCNSSARESENGTAAH
jgi:PAS domain S-box-containing protein